MSTEQPSEVTPRTDSEGHEEYLAGNAVSSESGLESHHPEVRSEGAESVPEFQQLNPKNLPHAGAFDLNRFGGVQVELTAELGRARLALKELMGLKVGTVLELDRSLSAPVEIFAQGTPLGNGEVVVIDERFAIRLKTIY